MNTENTFDMEAYFESLPVDTESPKYRLLSELHCITTVCERYWKTMPPDAQIAIMDAAERARALVREL